MALEGDFETLVVPVATDETRAEAAAYNAARKPGMGIMTDSGILFGPGDVPEIIDEPDYEKSLEISAAMFGGDKEDYRNPHMDQSTWEMLGMGNRIPEDVTGNYDAIPLPPTRVAQNQIQNMIDDSFTGRFFRNLDEIPVCCLAAMGSATESLALLERDLFRKAAETIDEARRIAANRGDVDQLIQVANAYRDLAGAAS